MSLSQHIERSSLPDTYHATLTAVLEEPGCGEDMFYVWPARVAAREGVAVSTVQRRLRLLVDRYHVLQLVRNPISAQNGQFRRRPIYRVLIKQATSRKQAA